MSVVVGRTAGHPVSACHPVRHRLRTVWLLPCLSALGLLAGCGGGEDYVSTVPPATTGTGTTPSKPPGGRPPAIKIKK